MERLLMSYLGKLNPKIGGGLGGIPENIALKKVPSAAKTKFLTSKLLPNRSVNSTTTIAGLLGYDVVYTMTSSATLMTNNIEAEATTSNASLESFMGAAPFNQRTCFRLPDTNFVIVGAAGTTKLLLGSDFSNVSTLTFTLLQNVGSSFLSSYNESLAYSKKIAENTYLLILNSSGFNSYALKFVTIKVENNLITVISTITSGANYRSGSVFKMSSFAKDVFMTVIENGNSGCYVNAVKVNPDYTLSYITSSYISSTYDLYSVTGNSLTLGNGKKYTISDDISSIIETTATLWTGGGTTLGNSNQPNTYFLTDTTSFINGVGNSYLIRCSNSDTQLNSIEFATTSAGSEVFSSHNVGSYKDACIVYGDTSQDAKNSALSMYLKEVEL
jgi:hypothetical protein